MWMSNPVDIEVARNTTTPIGFQFWDMTADAPLNISGFSFVCRVAGADGQSLIAIHSVDVINALIGQCDIIFDGRAYGELPGIKEFVKASYQVIANDGSNPVTAIRGSIFLVPGIN